MTGLAGNQYRAGNPILRSPKGTRGCWAILGQARGFMQGNLGKSYAICTVRQPGLKRSTPLTEIRTQVQQLYAFAAQHPELTLLVTKAGEPGKPSLNGYTLEENASCYLEQSTSTP